MSHQSGGCLWMVSEGGQGSWDGGQWRWLGLGWCEGCWRLCEMVEGCGFVWISVDDSGLSVIYNN